MANEDYYTWAEFIAEVKKLLPIDAARVGVGAEDYLTSLIRQACIDLQRVVPGFCINHETIYYPNDVAREGMAVRLVKPPQSKFRGLSIFKLKDGVVDSRYHAVPHPYENRFDLINASVAVNDGDARYSIDHAGYTLYAYPIPNDDTDWYISMFWDGQKLDFQDGEHVPFTEAAALAVSYFVRKETHQEVEAALPESARSDVKYREQKTKLYLDDKERRGVI